MNKWKKAISVGMSAALLASLFTVIAASSALASTSVTSVGSVPRGGTSTASATFLFTEKSVAAITATSSTNNCQFTVTILDSASNPTVHFVGAGTQSAPDSLNLSALSVGDNTFTVNIRANDAFNVETISIGGLQIKADAAAATGAIKANVTSQLTNGAPSTCFSDAFVGGTVTATGHLAQAYGIGATSFVVALDTGSCPFDLAGNVLVGTETVTPDAAPAANTPALGQYTFANTGDPFAINHLANEVVTQTASNCSTTVLGSPGTVTDSLIYNAPADQTRVFPGETNQAVEDLSATERTAGFLTASSTITLTITTPGVTFSMAPNADVTVGDIALTGSSVGTPGSDNIYGILSADRQSVSWTVNTKSTVASTIVFDGIVYDVAASVATGTAVNVTLATSAGVVVPTSRSNAVVGRVLNVTSTAPVVYIGENNQTAGQITITETGAGFFQSGTGSNNTLAVCIIYDGFSNSQFSSAPWAKVTAGDLKLREGTTASTDNVVQGTPITVAGFPFACYYWTVWTASTTASTVVISGDEAGTAGVKLNVPAGDAIGPVTASVRTGDVNAGIFSTILEARTVIAVKQFRNQVLVTALSQPTIAVGSTGSRAGDIQIQETANGQLKTGETICVQIVPNQNWNTLFDAYLKGLNTADLPIVTGSNGVIPTAVSTSFRSCNGQDELVGGFAGSLIESFSFNISQQSVSGNGKLVISNIMYATTNDAVTGQVQVMVDGYSGSNTQLTFQSIISNAKIGSVLAGTAASRLGVTQVGAFTTSTKVQKVGKYVTFRFDFGVAAAGAHVDIWAATKTGNDWTGFSKITSRVANASGVVYYYIRQSSATWKSYRGAWSGGGVMTPARQARWIP